MCPKGCGSSSLLFGTPLIVRALHKSRSLNGDFVVGDSLEAVETSFFHNSPRTKFDSANSCRMRVLRGLIKNEAQDLSSFYIQEDLFVLSILFHNPTIPDTTWLEAVLPKFTASFPSKLAIPIRLPSLTDVRPFTSIKGNKFLHNS